jgi:deazaflavin-dependent oxidoreductase (nitroreductase family)
MRGFVQNALRRFTRVMRPLALKSAGKEGSGTAVIRHTGRQSGRVYETPVATARNGDFFLIALPYGERTDWLRNVLSKGSAVIVTGGQAYEIDQPEIIPMSEVTAYFRPGEQRMQRQFRVASALRVRERPQAAPED